jgi:hypothetical protein
MNPSLSLPWPVVRNVSTSFSRQFAVSKGFAVAGNHSMGSSAGVPEDGETLSLRSDSPSYGMSMNSLSSKLSLGRESTKDLSPSVSSSISPSFRSSYGLRSMPLRTKSRSARTPAILVVGPPGWDAFLLYMSYCSHLCLRIGKSSMILANQAKWRCECRHLARINHLPNTSQLMGSGDRRNSKMQILLHLLHW